MYFKYPIIDTHIHVGDIEEINKAVKKAEYEQYVLLSVHIPPVYLLHQKQSYLCYHQSHDVVFHQYFHFLSVLRTTEYMQPVLD